MNRLVEYNQKVTLPKSYIDKNLELIQLDSYRVKVTQKEYNSGVINIVVNMTNIDDSLLHLTFSDWILDVRTGGMSLNSKSGGIIDGLANVADQSYLIFCFADDFGAQIGIGLYRIPKSTYQSTAAVKGASITLTNLTKAFRYAVGSVVRIQPTIVTEFNIATIITVDSETQITAITDNNGGYGTNITAQGATGGLIHQINNYTPNKPGTQIAYNTYYRVVGIVETDSSSPPEIVRFAEL